MSGSVPPAYLGLWRRLLLETPEGQDAESRVFWLQTARWHADLRIPAARPDFSQVQSLDECTRQHLEWLLLQEGFAGITQVDGELCEWHRRVDYRFVSWRDIGRMRFQGDILEEFGMERQYFERWLKVPLSYRQLSAEQVLHDGQPRLLLRAGDDFMHVRPRRISDEDVRGLWLLVEQRRASLDDLRQLADFEISFGTLENGAMRILHSTLPWLEGGLLPQIDDWSNLPGEEDE